MARSNLNKPLDALTTFKTEEVVNYIALNLVNCLKFLLRYSKDADETRSQIIFN